MSGVLDLLPWDAFAQFQAPQTKYVSMTAASQQVLGIDSTRVLIIFTASSNGGNIGVSTDPTASSNAGGIVLSTQAGSASQTLILPYWLYGPIVCSAWYGYLIGMNAQLNIITYNMTPYLPKPGAGLFDTVDTGPKPPPVKIDTAPGVNGKRGVLDYWMKLIAKLGIR